jgi:hypothetical protein
MIHEVGSWQHFVKRQDNLGLPIMEVKQKYLKEMNSSPIDLTSGGSRRTTSAPMIYVFTLWACCYESSCERTVYTNSPSIQVGIRLYTNPQLTIPFSSSPCPTYILNGCIEYESSSENWFNVDQLGFISAINQTRGC